MRSTELRKIREYKNITQEEMARELGYKDKSSYCLIENNKTKVSIDVAYKIKMILNLTQHQFENIFFDK